MNFLIDGFQLVGSLGSVGTYTRELIDGLVAAGCSITVAVPRAELNSIGMEMKASQPTLRWIIAPQACKPDESYLDLLVWNHQILPEIAASVSPDIHVSVYHHTPRRMPASVKRATIIHDCCGLRADCGYRPMGRAMMKHWSHLKSAATFADIIIPISKYTRSSFTKRFPSAASKVAEPIYNAVSSTPLNLEAAAITLDRLQLKPNGYLLALAMPSRRKGTDVLLEGYDLYRKQGGELPLVFFGSGRIDPSGWGVDEETSKSIRLLGRIDDQTRDGLFSSAIAFLFPSRCEGFGYPIVEAARRGCPVIAWQDTTAPEILPEEHWMPMLDPENVAREIQSKESWTSEVRQSTRLRLQRQSQRFSGNTLAASFMKLLETFPLNS